MTPSWGRIEALTGGEHRIVWCPVGIDITEEAHALAAGRAAGQPEES